MRLQAAALTASTLLGAGAVAGGIAIAAGRYGAAAALRNSPGHTHPAGFAGPALFVHGLSDGRIELTRTLASRLPGRFGLDGGARHAIVGPVLEGADAGPDTVVRQLEEISHGRVERGARLFLGPQVHIGNPRDALGLDHTDLHIAGELGALPAWFVPGLRDTWVIAVHGLGTTREQALGVLPFLHRLGLPVLALAYRGDRGAPRPPEGIGQLGHAEWRDLDAAMRYAARNGASRIVILGWSTGATMAMLAAARSPLRGRISGLILDSPVLDWQSTVRALAAARHIPRRLLPLAALAAEERTGLDSTQADAWGCEVPTLIIHGPEDTVAPWEASRSLVDSAPERITLHTVNGARHAAMWNADPASYEERLRRFLTPLL